MIKRITTDKSRRNTRDEEELPSFDPPPIAYSAVSGGIPAVLSVARGLTEQWSLKLPKNGAVSTGRCNTGLKFTRRRLKAQGLSRALIETQRDLVEMGLRVDGQVRLLRKVLS